MKPRHYEHVEHAPANKFLKLLSNVEDVVHLRLDVLIAIGRNVRSIVRSVSGCESCRSICHGHFTTLGGQQNRDHFGHGAKAFFEWSGGGAEHVLFDPTTQDHEQAQGFAATALDASIGTGAPFVEDAVQCATVLVPVRPGRELSRSVPQECLDVSDAGAPDLSK